MGKLKTLLGTGIATGLVSLLAAGKINAQQLSANVSARDNYVVVPGFVIEPEPVIQPSLTLSQGGFYGTLWSNFNTGRRDFTEVDYVAGCKGQVRGIDFDVSYNIFDLRDSGEDKFNDNLHELWITLSKQGVISPKLTLVQNFSAGTFENDKNNYAIFSLNHNGSLFGVPLSIDLSAQYSNRYLIDGRGFSIAQANVSIPFSVGDLSITPQIRLRKALDKENFDNSSDIGVSFGYKF